MKAMILAGGLGTRLSEETLNKPKPMVEIGGMPILWHIMKIYYSHGIRDFIICCGYRGYMIKEYFSNYRLHTSDVTIDARQDEIVYRNSYAEDWRITLVDTGAETMTGGRIKRALPLVGDETFCLTYGDGVADIDISASIAFHKRHGRKATVTAVRPFSRFGQLQIEGTQVMGFAEKPADGGGWINGGFFVLDSSVGSHIEGDGTVWERSPMESLAAKGEMYAFYHEGFWQPMDTLRDRHMLDALWAERKAPWIKQF